jgi:hypothetical protein
MLRILMAEGKDFNPNRDKYNPPSTKPSTVTLTSHVDGFEVVEMRRQTFKQC